MKDQKIENLNPAELEWIHKNIQLAKNLIQDYTKETELNAANLDEAYCNWYKDRQQTKEDSNLGINIFGIAFGNLLRENLDLEWKVVTDEYGTEIALHGDPGNILIFPPNLIAKRFEKGETHFFSGLLEAFRKDIGDLRK